MEDMPGDPGPAVQVRARFHIRSWPFCPLAQRAMVALAALGTGWTHDPRAPDGHPPLLTASGPGLPLQVVREPLAMLDLIETAHPDRPLLPSEPGPRGAVRELMQLGVAVQDALSAVTRATESNDHDIAIHRLRLKLERLDTLELSGAGRDEAGIDLAGVVLGPTLWRMRVLDRHCETYLMSGLSRVEGLEAALSAHPAMQKVFRPGAEQDYLATLHRRGAVLLAVADAATWRLLVGHGGRLRGAG